MVAERASAKGLHSLIRRDRRKEGEKKRNNTLVCKAASRNSPHSFLPLKMQRVCTFFKVSLIASFGSRMGGHTEQASFLLESGLSRADYTNTKQAG